MHGTKSQSTFPRLPAILLSMAFLGLFSVQCDRSGVELSHSTKVPSSSDEGTSNAAPVDIRVLLIAEAQQLRLSGSSGCSVYRSGGNFALLHLSAQEECRLRRSGGQWQLANDTLPETLIGPPVQTTILEIHPDEPGHVTLSAGDRSKTSAGDSSQTSAGNSSQTGYQGFLRCVALGADRFAVINVVNLEDYLAGVVPAEIYPNWHKAALRAQTIACRTYAIYQINRSGPNSFWDVQATQASQVYSGLGRESSRTTQAVNETRGIVLAYGAAGREKIFPAYFSSTCGGHTEDNSHVFGETLPPLAGRPCPYCGAAAPANLYRWPAVSIDKQTLNQVLLEKFPYLAILDRIVELRIAEQSQCGRVVKINLIGSNGQSILWPAQKFRLALAGKEKGSPLRSNWYTISDAGTAWRFENGQGFGHGVGLCQYGSESMATRGSDCVTILEHYYPEARLLRAY